MSLAGSAAANHLLQPMQNLFPAAMQCSNKYVLQYIQHFSIAVFQYFRTSVFQYCSISVFQNISISVLQFMFFFLLLLFSAVAVNFQFIGASCMLVPLSHYPAGRLNDKPVISRFQSMSWTPQSPQGELAPPLNKCWFSESKHFFTGGLIQVDQGYYPKKTRIFPKCRIPPLPPLLGAPRSKNQKEVIFGERKNEGVS